MTKSPTKIIFLPFLIESAGRASYPVVGLGYETHRKSHAALCFHRSAATVFGTVAGKLETICQELQIYRTGTSCPPKLE